MRKRNIKKIPKYAFGAKEITDLISAGGNITQGVNTGNLTANAVFSGLDTAGDVVSAVNPAAGMVVKGVAGVGKMVTGIVGTKGSVDPATGEITEGTGILGRRNRNKLKQQSGVIKNSIAAALNSQHYAADYYSENGYNDLTMSKGGIIPNTLAYLDDGELIRTPDGEISQIPEQGKPTDSNLVNVPVGTQVLSDKLKVPGTNKTFAEKGREIMKTGKKKGNDIYALNSLMLNDRNNLKKYNELLALQELMKSKRSIKNNIGKYDKGSDGVSNVQSASDLNWGKDIMKSPWFDSTLSMITPDNYLEYNQLQSLYTLFNFGDTKPGNVKLTPDEAVKVYQGIFDNKTDLNAAINDLYKNKRLIGRGGSSDKPEIWRDGLAGDATWLRHLGRNVTPEQLKYINDRLLGVEAYVDNSKDSQGNDKGYGMVKFRPIVKPVERNAHPTLGNFEIDNGITFNPSNIDMGIDKTSPVPRQNTNPENKNIDWNLDDIISNSAALIGPIANMTVKRSESSVPYTYTPKYGPTEWNISPLLDEINKTNAIARYNQSRLSPNTGAGLAFGIQSAVARNNAISRAYAEKNNMENQMAMQNAGIYNDAARYNTQALHTAAVENALNRAAARTIRNTGLSQLSTALQSMTRDKRLNNRDQAMLEYMRDFFNYGSTQDAVSKLYRNFR